MIRSTADVAPRRERSPRLPILVISSAIAMLCVGLPPAAAEVPSGWTEIAKDSYSRSNSSSWGSAEAGGSYSVTGTGAVATTGAAATAVVASGKTITAGLKSVSVSNVDLSDSIKFVATGTFDLMHGWNARVQSDGSAYSARIRVNNTGKATLGVSRINGSSSTWLSGITLPFTVGAGQTVRGDLQVSGVSPVQINLKAWVVGSTAPSWQVQYADSSSSRLQSAGSIAVYDTAVTSPGNVTFSHDDLSAGKNETAAQSPAAPAEPSEPSGTRGSATVGTASYSIPSGAVFVDASKGSDSNAGTQSTPMRTAVAAAGKARSGGVLVLRAGVYHESLTVASNKTITIQNYPGEAVWFDGSKVISSWTKSGSAWVTSGWTKEFSSSMGSDATFKARFIGSNSMAADPDQLFVNGTALKQVASAAAVTSGTFYVNDAADTITIGSDPSGKEVRASDLAQAINVSGPNSVIEGIGVRRYANGYEVSGAVRLGNTGGTIRNVVIQDVATIGLSLSNNNKTVDHVTVQRAGMLGIGGNQNDNSKVTNSVVTRNNTEHFKDAPVSGGLKFTAARTMTIDNVDASDNEGSCIWFDVSSYKMTIVNNLANRCTKHGIEVEVSDTGIIANNVATNGGEDGIIVFNSGNSQDLQQRGGRKLSLRHQACPR